MPQTLQVQGTSVSFALDTPSGQHRWNERTQRKQACNVQHVTLPRALRPLQSLQSSLATSAPMWVHQHQSRTHHVSSKPALESVPECAPAALACSNPYCPPANYTTSTAAPTNMYFAPSAKQEDSSVTAATSTFTTAAPTLSGGYSSSVEQPRAQQQQQGLSAPMYGGAAQPHQTMVPVAAPVTGRPVRNRKPTRQLPG